MSNYYHPVKYGPISVGYPTSTDILFTYGYGRTLTVVYSCDELKNDEVVPKETSDCVQDWIVTEWEDKIILDRHSPNIDTFNTLHEMGAVKVATMVGQYDSSLKSACQYMYDKLNQLVQLTTRGRVWIVEVEILEQRESYGFKTERYFSAHK